VETVKPYFRRFLAALPTVAALAAADEQQVLRLWEGLGYYRRARQLHAAARQIVAVYDGRFPAEPEAVAGLPGIGRYTAGAILSIAFDQRRPILEANTVRVFSRLLAYDGQTTSAAGQKLLWAAAEAVLPARDVGRFNQALMELGSEVCRSRGPRCEECPVATLCEARRRGLENEIPRPKPRPQFENVLEAAVVVRRGPATRVPPRVLVIQWPEGRRWAGLWDFPRFAIQADTPASVRRELVENVLRMTGVTISPGEHRKTIRHGVTRFRITLECYEAQYVSHNGGGEGFVQKWVRPAELEDLPLSSTGRKLAVLLRTQGNHESHK
jgi:A/G-specific adenine glycosylase